jgi:hypothetical protein
MEGSRRDKHNVAVTTTFIWGDASLSGAATTTVDAAGCDYDAGTTWSDNFTLAKA